jgi:hypothetical protein
VTSFRKPAALAVTAVLALIGSVPLASEGGWLVIIPLVPLMVAVWAWRAGTDVNAYGIRVRSLLRNRVVTWEDVQALVPDQRGGVIAALTDHTALQLTAVRVADIPRILKASGKTPAGSGGGAGAPATQEQAEKRAHDADHGGGEKNLAVFGA